MAEQCCKTCRHLKVPPNQAGRRVVRSANVYACTAVVDLPVLPDSITKNFGFQWPPSRRWMNGDEGRDCETWEARNG